MANELAISGLPTGLNIVSQVRDASTDFIFSSATNTCVPYVNNDRLNGLYDIPLVEQGTSGYYAANFGLTGTYYASFYLKTGSSPTFSYQIVGTSTVYNYPNNVPVPQPEPVTASGYYANDIDLYNVFGKQNITVWSDIINTDPSNATLNLNTVQSALTYADGEINAFMLDGPYSIPLTLNPITQSVMNNVAIYFAGGWLYQRRGILETDKEASKYEKMVKAGYSMLQKCKGGVVRLDAARRWPSPNAPVGGFSVW